MLEALKGLQKLIRVEQVKIDNIAMRLHYPISVIILLAFCAIVTAKQYVGEPIECFTATSIPKEITKTFCWINPTFTVPSSLRSPPDSSYPGIDDIQDEEKFRFYGYYQWVCFALFIQALAFYLPHWFWKSWEGGKMEALSRPVAIAVYTGHELAQKQHNLVTYLLASRGHHDQYTIKFFLYEILSLLNVVGQLFLLDFLFEGEFREYGFKVINFLLMNDDQRIDPMSRIFPKVTKCRFQRYGPSAGLDAVDALCVLPLNMINEKIYIFLWFWLLFLACCTFLTILYHLIVISFRPLWYVVTKFTFTWIPISIMKTIIPKCTFGDWFFLYLLGSNIDPVVFKTILYDLANHSSSKDEPDLIYSILDHHHGQGDPVKCPLKRKSSSSKSKKRALMVRCHRFQLKL